MPARLYLIDREGRVAFKSGRGPFGFKPEELEQAIAMNLLESTLEDSAALKNAPHHADGSSSSAASWSGLPRPRRGGEGPLPNWAAAVAAELPRTAAALLELDHAHRTKSPLDPGLRARLRYVIAHVNRCEYAERTALADLRRTGASESDVEAFLMDPEGWREDERDAMEFARRHSVDAPGIEDDLFERLRVRYGDRGAAAIVLLGAYGNFQDRLLLGLGISSEGQVPLPPLDVEFDDTVFETQPMLPPRSAATPLITDGTDVIVDDAEWSRLSYGELKTRLEAQRQRRQRLPTPTWEDAARGLPERLAARPTRIVWNLVCFGYVPELAAPWTTATRTMWAEAAQDRVFEESLFWVQTRAVQCSYCMGHCEMLLELAGLDASQIEERLQSLAGDDWSGFPPQQQRAFAYARKLSLTPWQLTRDDYAGLERDLGPKEAMAVFFWLCRGLYMTRVSDGFQLQLESTNVFADFDAAAPLSKK
jgi:alkylhydroperoxidase family enzyme